MSSTKTSRKTSISLKSFYIFNSEFGPNEGEEEKKVLFYHPKDENIDKKIKDVGLSEAIIKFTNTFKNDDSVQSLHTQKTCQLYYQPATDPDFWLIMTLYVPFEVKKKDNTEYKEYSGDDIHDAIFQAVLKQSYQMFRLFCGSFRSNLVGESASEEVAHLLKTLDNFYSKYLQTLRLSNCDVLDQFKSINYLPLEQHLFLRIQNFINMIESTFDTVKHCIFLYNERVAWSGINCNDLSSLYEYLAGTIFPKYTQNDAQGGALPQNYAFTASHHGVFITGPESFNCDIKIPKIYIYDGPNKSEEFRMYYLIIYRSLSATICMLVDDVSPINDELYQELHTYIGPQLASISTEISNEVGKNAMGQLTLSGSGKDDSPPKFLYYNSLGLRHQSTIHVNSNRNQKMANVAPDILNLIADLYNDDRKSPMEESIIKTHNDFWVVKRKSNSRYFFIVINKSSSLVDIIEETKKITQQAQQLRDIQM